LKKLAIVVLLVLSACSRKANVTSTTATEPEIAASGSGAIGPREALQRFMAAAKAQDIQAMADIWGTKDGPARSNMSKEQLEQRIIYMMRCLRHDSFSILSESPAADGERMYSVEVRRGTLTPKANFTSTPGPKSRWYLRNVDLEPLSSICVSK
jgi:hypothetical protein